jgi:atypical dual specificity phosphatase
MNRANLGPVAPGAAVYGACRPGHLGGGLDSWVDALRDAGVETVCCLLSTSEARRWKLPERYADTFETAHVPVRDRHLPTLDELGRALAVLDDATADGRAALHCNAGLGRTGVVAAAWLARERDLAPERAVRAVEEAPVPRAPREAIRDGNATEADLYDLLARVADHDNL